jgi:hypothetical protein
MKPPKFFDVTLSLKIDYVFVELEVRFMATIAAHISMLSLKVWVWMFLWRAAEPNRISRWYTAVALSRWVLSPLCSVATTDTTYALISSSTALLFIFL